MPNTICRLFRADGEEITLHLDDHYIRVISSSGERVQLQIAQASKPMARSYGRELALLLQCKFIEEPTN